MIFQEEFEQMADELIENQGFVVIGFPPGVAGYKLGDQTNKIMQFTMPDDYQVFASAEQIDWKRQNDLVAKLRPGWRRFPDSIGGTFVKLRPVTASIPDIRKVN